MKFLFAPAADPAESGTAGMGPGSAPPESPELRAAKSRIAELEEALKAAGKTQPPKPGAPSFADKAAKHNALLAAGKHEEARVFHQKHIVTHQD